MGEVLLRWIALFGFAMAVGLVISIGEMLVGKDKQSVASRLRGAAYWAIFSLSMAAGIWLSIVFMRTLGWRPLFSLDFAGLGGQWTPVLRYSALTALTLISVFLSELAYYWFHRLQHAWPFLWRFHAVHHSIEELNAINCSHHWTEGLARAALLTIPQALLFNFRFEEVLAVTILAAAWPQFVHANSRIDFGRLRWLIGSPRFHRVHHSIERRHFDKNFAAIFPLIDVMFGTAVFPAEGEEIKTGLSDKYEPVTLREYLIALRDKPASPAS